MACKAMLQPTVNSRAMLLSHLQIQVPMLLLSHEFRHNVSVEDTFCKFLKSEVRTQLDKFILERLKCLQGYEGSDTLGAKGKGVIKSAASRVKDAVQPAAPSKSLQQKQEGQNSSAPKPAFKNPLLARREAEEATKKAASGVKSAAADLPKVKLPNPFDQSAPEKQPETPKAAFKNPLAEKRDAEAAAKKAVSAVKDAVSEPPLGGLLNPDQKPKLPKAPTTPKPAFKNPLLEKRDAEAAAKKSVSAVKDAVPDVPKFELPNLFEQKPELPKPESAPKPAFKNPLLEKRDAEAAAKKAVSAVKDAVPDVPKFDLPNLFEQKPELPKPESAPKPAFKNPLLEKRDAEAAAKKAVSAVKDAVPDVPKFDLPNLFEQKPELPKPESAPKSAFKNPLLEKRDAEAAAKKAVSAVKDAVPDVPKFDLPNLFEQKPELPKPESAPKSAFKNPLLEKRDAEAAAKKAVSAVKDAVPDIPKIDLPNIFEQKPELPQPESAPKPAFRNPLLEKRDAEAAAKKAVSALKDAVPDTPKIELPKPAPTQKPAFENPLLAKRKAEDAVKGAASSVSKAVEDVAKQATSSNPLGAAAGAAAGAAGSESPISPFAPGVSIYVLYLSVLHL